MLNSRQRFLGTTQQHAYLYLREMILSGAYVGGQKINTAVVADELEISRMPGLNLVSCQDHYSGTRRHITYDISFGSEVVVVILPDHIFKHSDTASLLLDQVR